MIDAIIDAVKGVWQVFWAFIAGTLFLLSMFAMTLGDGRKATAKFTLYVSKFNGGDSGEGSD